MDDGGRVGGEALLALRAEHDRDALVRQRMIEMHGGSRALAVGTRAQPGPLYGVTSHAWQALAVGVVALQSSPDVTR